MGEVWRGTDTTLGREVAVKLLKHEYADDATFRARFETEARHAASLHHPDIAAVYDFGEATPTDGSGVHRPYLVMELVDGQPLSALLRARPAAGPRPSPATCSPRPPTRSAPRTPPASCTATSSRPTCWSPPTARSRSPTSASPAPPRASALTETGQVMGTPQYLSPEQAQGKTATPASDVYSLGVVRSSAWPAAGPFVGETAVATALAHLREPVPDLPDDVPADLAAVVRRALAKDPAGAVRRRRGVRGRAARPGRPAATADRRRRAAPRDPALTGVAPRADPPPRPTADPRRPTATAPPWP